MVKISEFIEAFTKAEEEIAFAEMAVGCLSSDEDENCVLQDSPRGVVVPAINELRYAAKHLSNHFKATVAAPESAKAILKNKTLEGYCDEQVQRAIRHCIRSRVDALKAVVLYLARDFYSFSGDYRKCNIPAKDKEILNNYRKKIWDTLEALSKYHTESTDGSCEKLKEVIGELHQIYVDTADKRGSYAELLASVHSHHSISNWQFCISNAVSMVIGILSVLATLYVAGFFGKQ